MMASLSSPLLLTLPYSSVLEVYNNINITSSLYIPSISFTISSCRAKFFSVFDKQDRILWRSGIRMCTIVVKAFPLQNFEDAKLETFRGVTCYAGFYRVINHTCCADGSVVQAVCNSSVFCYVEGQCPLASYHSYYATQIIHLSNELSCGNHFDMTGCGVTCKCPIVFGGNTQVLANSNMLSYSRNSPVALNANEEHPFITIAYTAKAKPSS